MLEYRLLNEETLLFAKDLTPKRTARSEDSKRKRSHEGPVFDIVDINYSVLEDQPKKDQDQSERRETASQAGEISAPEVLRHRGRQFIRIYSRPIINALQSVVEYYPRQTLVGHPVQIKEPYAILAHHWDELKAFRQLFDPKETTPDAIECELTETYEHLGYLLDFLEERMGDKIRKEKERWARPIPSASYEMLWLLLKPGCDVFFDKDNGDYPKATLEPAVLSRVEFEIVNQTWEEYSVCQWQYESNDVNFMTHEIGISIFRFSGEKPINELRVYPVQYAEDADSKRKQLIERGKRFFGLRKKSCMYFDGLYDETLKKKVSSGLSPRNTLTNNTVLGLCYAGSPTTGDRSEVPCVRGLCQSEAVWAPILLLSTLLENGYSSNAAIEI